MDGKVWLIVGDGKGMGAALAIKIDNRI